MTGVTTIWGAVLRGCTTWGRLRNTALPCGELCSQSNFILWFFLLSVAVLLQDQVGISGIETVREWSPPSPVKTLICMKLLWLSVLAPLSKSIKDNPSPKFCSGKNYPRLEITAQLWKALESLITILAEWPLPPLPAQRSELAASYVRSPRECLQIKPVHREVSWRVA